MAARLILAATLLLSLIASFDSPRAAPIDRLPRLVLWAWERPVDLRALPPGIGVAFLAQTVTTTARAQVVSPRRQPLRVSPATPLIAVTRIETPGGDATAPIDDVARAIASTARLPRVTAVQIDFDATLSQRPMYRGLLHAVRRELPRGMPLSITALASWCMQDNWLDDLPIDEAVPMLFRMGPAEQAASREASRVEAAYIASVRQGILPATAPAAIRQVGTLPARYPDDIRPERKEVSPAEPSGRPPEAI